MALDPKVKEQYNKIEAKTDSFLARLIESKGTAILIGVAVVVILVAAYILFR